MVSVPFVVTSGDYPQLFETGNQVFLGTVALDPVAVPTEQLKVLEVVRPAGVDGNEVVRLQVSEVEGGGIGGLLTIAGQLAQENVSREPGTEDRS